jgi:3-hydroxyisobutyrate dehydrogenase
MSTIGFIGLGHMGTPMVKNLLKHQHTVKVFDLASDAIENLVKQGALPATSFAEVAHDADMIFTMLPTGQDVEKTWCDPEGLMHHAKPGTLLIDSSSIDVETTRRLAVIA